ncbi:hypothetical protein [Tardiphaga sp. P9-11]|uniref:hypothetical protein n=1 Tax=Tardiphaga sp. P9-11 TaxID=2024614 RepID=UPI0011F0CCA7|nr:hypothetical protein [Tardiphaga sp. P9-11]KAA0076119.1 hypothetical protein CIW50_07610 [Tardiphaga sp. P9-11]
MPYRIINDGAAAESAQYPHITLQGPEIDRCETRAQAMSLLTQYAAGGMDVSAVGCDPAPAFDLFAEDRS